LPVEFEIDKMLGIKGAEDRDTARDSEA